MGGVMSTYVVIVFKMFIYCIKYECLRKKILCTVWLAAITSSVIASLPSNDYVKTKELIKVLKTPKWLPLTIAFR